MKIAIPSKGRAGTTKTDKLLKSAWLYVPESEASDYRRFSDQVIEVPGEVKGITATRNWIMKNSKDRHIVFVDDDLKKAGYIKLYENKCRHKNLTETQWILEWQKLFQCTENLQWKIFGLATDGAPRSVYPYRPFLFRSYITASCMGIINDGSYYFDEEFKVKEDYEIGLRHVKEFGGVLCCRFLYWTNSHWKDDGGCKDYRTQKMEREAIRKLLKLYPGYIKQVKRGGSNYSIDLNF